MTLHLGNQKVTLKKLVLYTWNPNDPCCDWSLGLLLEGCFAPKLEDKQVPSTYTFVCVTLELCPKSTYSGVNKASRIDHNSSVLQKRRLKTEGERFSILIRNDRARKKSFLHCVFFFRNALNFSDFFVMEISQCPPLLTPSPKK